MIERHIWIIGYTMSFLNGVKSLLVYMRFFGVFVFFFFVHSESSKKLKFRADVPAFGIAHGNANMRARRNRFSGER